ncbi:MAG TPA: hypothetical protein VM866_12285 [Pyrinomonadaceae bacterium]|nr:hypothetical protein [Pyrinomonadaceae bacterium]
MNDDFRPAARKIFDFLIDDFGFSFTDILRGNIEIFDKMTVARN